MISACRPLWQVLSVAQPGRDTTLSCDECFAILELLAEAAAAGAHAQTLREAVQRHLTHCPDSVDPIFMVAGLLARQIHGRNRNAVPGPE